MWMEFRIWVMSRYYGYDFPKPEKGERDDIGALDLRALVILLGIPFVVFVALMSGLNGNLLKGWSAAGALAIVFVGFLGFWTLPARRFPRFCRWLIVSTCSLVTLGVVILTIFFEAERISIFFAFAVYSVSVGFIALRQLVREREIPHYKLHEADSPGLIVSCNRIVVAWGSVPAILTLAVC